MNELQNQLDQGLEELGAREDRGQYNLSGSRPKRSQTDPNGGEDEDERTLENIQDADVFFGRTCPENNAWVYSEWWSVIWLNWLNPLMKLGTQKILNKSDIWNLAPAQSNSEMTRKFAKLWTKELESGSPDLKRAFKAMWGTRFYLGGLLRIFYDLSQFVGPYMLSNLIEVVKDPTVDPNEG